MITLSQARTAQRTLQTDEHFTLTADEQIEIIEQWRLTAIRLDVLREIYAKSLNSSLQLERNIRKELEQQLTAADNLYKRHADEFVRGFREGIADSLDWIAWYKNEADAAMTPRREG